MKQTNQNKTQGAKIEKKDVLGADRNNGIYDIECTFNHLYFDKPENISRLPKTYNINHYLNRIRLVRILIILLTGCLPSPANKN